MAPSRLLQGDAYRDPSNTGPRASHSIPNGGTFSTYAEIHISAPPKSVYDAILDIAQWKEWNSFVYDVHITSHPHPHHKYKRMEVGTNMTFHVKMTENDKTTSRETCVHADKLKTPENHDMPRITRIRWMLHNAGLLMPAFVLKSEVTNEIEELEDGTTQYRRIQVMGGIAANTVKKKYEQVLKDRAKDWCEDLKRYAEKQQQALPDDAPQPNTQSAAAQ